MSSTLGTEITLSMPFAAGLERTQAALKAEGFGIISTIDMQAAFKEKLGKAFRPYVILGACNPPLAFRAITASPEIGLLLPCNVTVEEAAHDRTLVRLISPSAMFAPVAGDQPPAVHEIAADAEARLTRVAADLGRGASL